MESKYLKKTKPQTLPKEYKKLIAITIILFLVGAGVGYGLGWAHATEMFIDKSINYLQSEGVNITIDSDFIAQKIQKWSGK